MDNSTLKALAMSLKFRQMRQDLISSNLANQDTPGFKSKRLDFEDALSRALDIDKQNSLKTTNNNHYNVGGGGFDNVAPEIYEDPSGEVSEDGNTVDRDFELAQMAQNRILYDATINLLNKNLALKKYLLTQE